MDRQDLVAVAAEPGADAGAGTGLDLDMDEDGTVPLMPQRHPGEEVELAPTSPRPVGEELLVEEGRTRGVEMLSRAGADEHEEVSEECPEQSRE
jgi:hypothetical protein